MNKIKIKKSLSIILFLCLFLATVQGTAYAANYVLLGFGQSTATFNVNPTGMSLYSSYVVPAINSWNNASSKVHMSINYLDANHTVSEIAAADTWYGVTTQGGILPSGRTTTFAIRINTNTSTSSTVQSTIAHELGHVLNLDDIYNIVAPNNMLMNNYRDRTLIKTPQTDDIAGVNASY